MNPVDGLPYVIRRIGRPKIADTVIEKPQHIRAHLLEEGPGRGRKDIDSSKNESWSSAKKSTKIRKATERDVEINGQSTTYSSSKDGGMAR